MERQTSQVIADVVQERIGKYWRQFIVYGLVELEICQFREWRKHYCRIRDISPFVNLKPDRVRCHTRLCLVLELECSDDVLQTRSSVIEDAVDSDVANDERQCDRMSSVSPADLLGEQKSRRSSRRSSRKTTLF